MDVQLDRASVTATGSAGTTAPAALTSETWSVAALASIFPSLLTGETHTIVDATPGATLAQQSERIRITGSTGSGATSVTVTRGVDGSTVSTHATGSIFNVVLVANAIKPTGLPPYARGRRGYEAIRNFYGGTPEVLAQARIALGKTVAGLGRFHIAVIGDSHSAGYFGATANVVIDQSQAWPVVCRDRLIASGIPSGGTGHVLFGGGMTTADVRWTSTGGWTRTNGGVLWGTVAAAGATATLDLAGGGGVGVEFLTVDFSENLAWVIKNSAGTTIDSGTTANGGTLTAKLVARTGLTDAKTLVLTTQGSATAYLASANIYKPSGVILSNFALYGSQISGSSGWESNSLGYGYRQMLKAAVPSPDLLVVMAGGNDKVAGATEATISSAYTTVFNDWDTSHPSPAGPSKIIGGQWQAGGFSNATWETYIASLYTLADTLGVGLMDLHHRSGGYSAMNARGVMLDGGSGTHPDRPVHYDTGRALADLLLS